MRFDALLNVALCPGVRRGSDHAHLSPTERDRVPIILSRNRRRAETKSAKRFEPPDDKK